MAALVYQIKELTVNGKNLFREWLSNLDVISQVEVDVRIERVKKGNWGDWRYLGGGVSELKFRSGLRIYFGKEGSTLILIINGGTKQRQYRDISEAKEIWKAYISD